MIETSYDYKMNEKQRRYVFLKSCIDFFIALVALIALLPLFLIVAIAIKIDSPGPVFFFQERVGKGRKPFKCVKFRSMSIEANHDIAGYEYAEAQAFVTRVGSIIRRFSIDELPQLFNVLTLKMSLIGYRPSQFNEYELNRARDFYNVHQIKPGISGWAQVNGRDFLASNPKKKVQFDSYYCRNLSFSLDFKIFVLTIVKILKRDGVVEGVVECSTQKECSNKEEIMLMK